jgi:hypothetical protein
VIASTGPSASTSAPPAISVAATQNAARRPILTTKRSPASPTAIAPNAISVVCRLTAARETSSSFRSAGSAGPSA